jgi:hypothetical protein
MHRAGLSFLTPATTSISILWPCLSPGYGAAPAEKAAAAQSGDHDVVSLLVLPSHPAQRAVSTCRHGDGSYPLWRQCR